ncbi:MAG TPA: TIGR04290 family methyltransferase [Gemmatimonadales bacterium]|nr:TIGR04290 family methyltransferase [Gemmatimonadales bacterium]
MSARPEPRTAADERLSAIRALGPWFHNLHLPGGVQTAPDHFLGDFPGYKWAVVAELIPQDLRGWRALDVGCNAGYYAFELARRGAAVTGIDVDEHYLRQARWAARELGLEEGVEFRRMQVYDLAGESERYDLVLFMGVLYHLRYPLLGLDIVARVVRRLLVFQTLMIPEDARVAAEHDPGLEHRDALRVPGWPALAFVERRLAGDPTNWWVPNEPAVEAMLRSSGLSVVRRPGHEIFLCEPAPPGAPDGPPYDITPELLAATGRLRE